MPDASDSPSPRPDVAAVPVPIARADATSRAQRLLHAAGSTAKEAVATVGAPVKAAARTVKRHLVPQYTLGEEIANSITHGIGVALGIAALVVMVVKAAVDGAHPASLASAIIFGVALILEYLASTLYHAIAVPAAKRVFRVIDHSCIYLLIAGTYTPFCLITLADAGGIPLCIAVWAIAIAGVLFEAFMRERQPHLAHRRNLRCDGLARRLPLAAARRRAASHRARAACRGRRVLHRWSGVLRSQEDSLYAQYFPPVGSCRQRAAILGGGPLRDLASGA